MLKLYYYLQSKIQSTELKLSGRIEKKITEPYNSNLFYFNLVALNLLLVFLQITTDLFKFIIILTRDPGISFNIFFKQRELRSCPYSYSYYKTVQAKVKLFSFAGASTIVFITVVTSLVTNLMFGGKLPTFAATYGWTQTSWSDGVDAVNNPSHSVNKDGQSGWLRFFSSNNINASDNELKIATSTTSTSTTSFSAGTGSNYYINAGVVTMKKNNSAFCSTTTECSNSGCDYDFATSTGSKYCHNTSNCTDLTNSAGNYQRASGYNKCSGNSYYKNCNANGSWDAAVNNPFNKADCGAQGDPSKGGYTELTCTDGSEIFTPGTCYACSNNFTANATKDGCYASCASNDNAKCITGYHCYSVDSTCQSNAAGSLCDSSSDCSSIYCLNSICQPPPACDGTSGTFTCGMNCIYNGDIYATVQINTTPSQCWFAENLRTTKKADGVTDISATAYCNPAGCGSPWGRLYPWSTAMNNAVAAGGIGAKIQGICPTGWHIPSDYGASASDDLQKLSNYLGGDSVSGGALKQTGTTYWISQNTGATNSSGFAALPTGYWNSGSFVNRGFTAPFWSSSEYSATFAWYRYLYNIYATQYRYNANKTFGISVRCIKD